MFGPSQKPIEVLDKPVEKTPLDIPLPDPVEAKAFKWNIITRANAEQIFTDLEKRGENVVLFAVSDSGYQQLSITVAEMRNLISQYRNIVIKYKEYYEPAKPAEKK